MPTTRTRNQQPYTKQHDPLITTRMEENAAYTSESYTNPFDIGHQALANLEPVDAFLSDDTELYSARFVAIEDPNESDRPHSPGLAFSQHQPSQIPRPSLTRSHKSAPSALLVRVSESHQDSFVMDHQDLDRYDPASHPWSQNIELKKMTKTLKESKDQPLAEGSTTKTANSSPGLVNNLANYLLPSWKIIEIPNRSIRGQLEEELQQTILKLQDLVTQERAARDEMIDLISRGQLGQTSVGLARHLLRMQVRQAELEVEDIRARLYEEREHSKVVVGVNGTGQ